uniref:G-protein coupled receptors family 1 profile domain-containing protein n=1 Tax=Timema bartmani TaxID=61472 RepID=A0A7R9HX05_9NEOP|nr:unnamed protein product [Timema bartmani]
MYTVRSRTGYTEPQRTALHFSGGMLSMFLNASGYTSPHRTAPHQCGRIVERALLRTFAVRCGPCSHLPPEINVRNATAAFIINLSVSDLMFCCFNLPLAASMFWQRAWRHGELLCQLFPLLRYGLVAVSLFTVLAITINRYVMIGHPRMYPNTPDRDSNLDFSVIGSLDYCESSALDYVAIEGVSTCFVCCFRLYSKKYLGLMVACTWMFGFGALIATWVGVWGRFGLDRCIGSCSILPDDLGRSPKEFLFVVAFLIPCLAIVVCYARIFYIVRKTALKSRVTTRSNTVTNTTTNSTASGGDRRLNGNSSGYEDITISGKFIKRCNFSIAEDSAIGSTSTGPSISTDKSSAAFIENGHTSPQLCNNNRSSPEVKIQVSGNGMRLDGIKTNLNVPNPNLLSPPSPSSHRVIGEPSSSSGVDVNHENEEYDHSSRSATPTSLCSSLGDPTGPTPQRNKSLNRKRRRKERMPSAVAVNSALSHVASVFRRGSNLRASPRRQSTMTNYSGVVVPGKMTPKDRKLLKMILVIFASFVVCYLPITLTKTFHSTIDNHALNVAGYLLIYLSTCINPIIYVVMSSEYRQAYKNLLVCKGYGAEMNPQHNAQGGVQGRGGSQRA